MISTILKIGLLAGGIVVTFTIAEVGLRLFVGITNSEPSEETAPSKPGLMREDIPTEWYPREEGVHERVSVDGRPFVLRINSTGQRGSEVGERQAGELRTLFLGDSFTMAHRQPEEDTFVGRSAELFERKLPFPVKCINGGVNGYSTCQELAYYRYLGRKLKPDIVVLCFFLGNDFRDNMIGTRQARSINPVLIPTFERFVKRHQEPFLRRGDTTLRDPISGDFVLRPSAEWLETIERNSLFARLIGSRYASLVGKWTGDISLIDRHSRYYFYEIGLFQRRSEGLFQTAVELTQEAVLQLHRMVLEDGAELAVVLLPSQLQVDEECWQSTLADLGMDEDDLGRLDKHHPNRLMSDFCASRGISVLDLHERFATASDPSKLYSAAVDDRHFSAAGQAVAAEAMVEFLAPLMGTSFNEATQSYRAGLESMDRRRFAEAQRALSDAAQLRPRWSAPHVALGELHGQSGRLQKAAHHFNEAIARHPDSWRAREGFAEVCVAGGDLENAIQAYLQALKLRPAWWPYRERLQQLHQRRGETDVAATHRSAVDRALKASLPVRRLWWSEHHETGAALAARRKWSEAEREFIRAAAFLPDKPESHYNLGSLYERLSKPDKAAASYRNALGVAPDFAPAKERLNGLNAN